MQSRTITTYCSGASASCNGATTTSSYQDSADCSTTQTCNSSSFTCQTALGCGNTWCDSSTGLCWTLSEPAAMPLAEATSYCNNLVIAGRSDWRLPTIQEWLRLAKGCDEDTGQAQPLSFQSNCTYDSANPALTPCASSCPYDEGPGNGCYGPPGMGACTTRGYWSSTVGVGTYYFHGDSNWVVRLSNSASQDVRCVVVQ